MATHYVLSHVISVTYLDSINRFYPNRHSSIQPARMCDTLDTSTTVDDVVHTAPSAPKKSKKPVMTRTTTTAAIKKAPRMALAKTKKQLSVKEQSEKVKLKISRSKETKLKNKAAKQALVVTDTLDNSEITPPDDAGDADIAMFADDGVDDTPSEDDAADHTAHAFVDNANIDTTDVVSAENSAE